MQIENEVDIDLLYHTSVPIPLLSTFKINGHKCGQTSRQAEAYA